MIENCLRHKIIRDFLKLYTENKWKDLIPILIEIGILNLQKTFNKLVFSNDELKKFSKYLQHEQIEKDKEKNKDTNKEIYDSLENDNELNKNMNLKNSSKVKVVNKNESEENIKKNNNENNQEKNNKLKNSNDVIKEMKEYIKNNYQLFKNNISIDFQNKIAKQKKEYFKKIITDKNSKNLRPESISKKVNNNITNNTNIKTDYTTNPSNKNYNSSYMQKFSSEKKLVNNSKSKDKNKDKNLNLNIDNSYKMNNIKNIKRKHYNIGRQINKNNIIRIGGNEKPNYYKKLNNIIQKCQLMEKNKFNNKLKMNKNKESNNFNKQNNYSHNNYYKNNNFISTLFQRINSTEQYIKNSDKYFSNRDELEDFIKDNRVNNIKLNQQDEKEKLILRKSITKSEKPVERNNSVLKLEEKEINKNSNIKQNKDKKSTKSIKNKDKIEIDKKNLLLKSFPSKKNFLPMKKNEDTSPKKFYLITDKETINSSKETKVKEFTNKNEINNINNNETKKEGLKTIKLFDIKKEENKDNKVEDNNKENNDFKKNVSNNRYVNIFGTEGEDFSLTQMEKEYSGIFDSSISNDNQINPELFFKDSPKNVFKNEKSDEQSMNSHHKN